MSDKQKLKNLRVKHSVLDDDFKYWKLDFQSLAKVFYARKLRYLEDIDTNKGGLRLDILDGTGVKARRVLSAGMHGGMTSPARPWFRLTLADPDMVQFRPVKEWLNETEIRMRSLLARSNFYMAIHSLYNELGVFGTGFMFEHSDPKMSLRFNTLTVGEYVLDINEHGMVDTIFRTLDLTARNIVRMFGIENCSEQVKRAYDKPETQLARFKIVHAILPNEDRDPLKLTNRNMPFASYYYEKDTSENKFLRQSGYQSLPGFGPRWDLSGQDTYGFSPAMDSLGDARMLQSVRATYLKQEHKKADPPMAYPQGLNHLDTLPGGVNPVNAVNGSQQIYPIQNVSPDTRGILEITRDVRESIREGMYNDLFRMLALSPTRQMTATEVAERHEEKLLQLGPVLERLHAELFTPLIDRTFNIMESSDLLVPPPEEIQGMPLKVEFVSLLAQAQKMVATNSVDQFMGFIGNYGQAFPEMLDIPDIDEVGDRYAEYLGIETKLLTDKQSREEKRQARAQQQQAMQAAEAVNSDAQAAKTMAETPVRGGQSTALDALLAGVV